MSRRIQFHETDMAGIVHFANYFRFMEETEHAFLRSLGHAVHQSGQDGSMQGFVRVHASCEYLQPLHYEDEIELRLTITARTAKSVEYHIGFFRTSDAGGSPADVQLATGVMRVVYVERSSAGDRIRAAEIPPELDVLLQTDESIHSSNESGG